MKKKFDAVIFDMDGVLVDESRSYRYAIEKTVNFILSRKNIIRKILQEEIKIIKNIPAFNNDWDVSFVLISLVEQRINIKKYINKIQPVTPQIRKTNKYLQVKDIFQSYYLGEKLFREIYNRPPPLSNRQGLNLSDSLLIDKTLLDSLVKKYKLGIATSRPRFEALFAAKSLDITPQFIKEEFIVAKEDALKEKPDPASLRKIIKRIKAKNPIYIGDTINDVIAAKKAGMPCIFIGDKNLSDYQFTNINKIREIFL